MCNYIAILSQNSYKLFSCKTKLLEQSIIVVPFNLSVLESGQVVEYWYSITDEVIEYLVAITFFFACFEQYKENNCGIEINKE